MITSVWNVIKTSELLVNEVRNFGEVLNITSYNAFM